LRAVAVAALIVLVLHPQALTGPGFQMSFAATTALVATFRVTRGWDGRLPGWARPVFALVLASVVAGAATAPIAAAHFNRVPHFGLIANLLSVPLMGTIIMPAAVLAALLAPFGLDGLAYAVMRPAIAWILGVSDWVAGLDRAISHVPAPGPWVLPLVACGALWLILWQGRGRVLGPVAMAIGLALWTGVDRPPVLIADTGGLIGVMTDTGRALSKPRGDGFAALAWLENDGDGSDQRTAHDRPAPPPVLAGQTLVHITGQKATTRAAAACARGVILVTTIRLDPAGDCLIFDARRLALTGAVALSEDKGVLKIETAAARAGTRPWNDWVRAAQ
jgi:competence protein ComEC